MGRWGGFVFVTVDPDAPSLEEYLEILPEHFASWDLGERYLTAHVVRVVPCNWKVALEAFIESYHTVAVHPQLLKTSGDTQTQYDVYEGVRHVNRMITPVGIASEHVRGGGGAGRSSTPCSSPRTTPTRACPTGGTARQVLAERTRRQLAERTGGDYSVHHRLRGARRHRVLRVPQLRAVGGVHHASRLPVPAPR